MLDKLLRWRTFVIVMTSFVVSLIALWYCEKSANAGPALFSTFMNSMCILVAIAAGKSAVEHLGNGTGIAGMVKNLTASNKTTNPVADAPKAPPAPAPQPPNAMDPSQPQSLG